MCESLSSSCDIVFVDSLASSDAYFNSIRSSGFCSDHPILPSIVAKIPYDLNVSSCHRLPHLHNTHSQSIHHSTRFIQESRWILLKIPNWSAIDVQNTSTTLREYSRSQIVNSHVPRSRLIETKQQQQNKKTILLEYPQKPTFRLVKKTVTSMHWPVRFVWVRLTHSEAFSIPTMPNWQRLSVRHMNYSRCARIDNDDTCATAWRFTHSCKESLSAKRLARWPHDYATKIPEQ